MKETIGNRIQKYRKEKGLTQEELAGKMGVSSQAVSKWENDISCPDIGLLPQLCRVLGVSADELISGKQDQVQMLPPQERKSLDEMTMRVLVNSAEGDKVRVNLPMSLVKIAMEMGVEILPNYVSGIESVKSIDLDKIMALVERGAIGKLVEVQSAEGHTVEVVVE